MVNGCEFCSKIWDNAKAYKESFEFEYQEGIAIVTDSDGPGLYVPCDDWYYSTIVMNINFCPKCGRQVNLNYKAQR